MKYFLFSILFSISFLYQAQDSLSFSMDQAVNYALENHLSIKKSSLELQKSIQQKKETQGIGLPQINAEGSFNHFPNLPVQVLSASFFNPFAPEEEIIAFRAGTKFNTNAALQINQLLFNGSYIVGLEFSRFLIDMQEAFIEKSELEVCYQVKLAYQASVVAKENLVFLDSMLYLTQKTFLQQKDLVELGALSPDELHQIEFLVSSAKSRLKSAEIQYKNSLLALKISMFYPLEKDLILSEDVKSITRNNLLPKGSIENNIDLKILKNQEQLTKYDIKNNIAVKLPSLSASFQHAYNAYRNKFDFFADKPWYPQTIWGIKLGIPIYSGGQKNAKIQQSKIELLKNQNDTKLLEYNLNAQEIQIKRNYQNALINLELQEKNISLAQKIYKNSLIRKDLGAANNLIITQQYNQLISAKTSHNLAYLEVLQTQINLEKIYNQILNTK